MKSNGAPIQNYIAAKENIMNFFNCKDDFFIKIMENHEWAVIDNDDFCMLSYWNTTGKRTDAVVIKKSGVPMVLKTEDYTMVVAIDCVKIAFVFKNEYLKS